MTFVPGFTYDVFVSYAHADERVDPPRDRWVSNFIELLQGALPTRLGERAPLRWFFDTTALRSNDRIDEVLHAARHSAVFLAVASRSYCASDWTKRELDAFVKGADDTRRLFAVECLPLATDERYPPALEEHKRLALWRKSGTEGSAPITLSPDLDAHAFRQRVIDLAEQMSGQLLTMRKAAGAPIGSLAATTVPINPGAKSVLLAQVTDDLEDQRDDLRRYLGQYGVPVLRPEGYPLGGDAFRTAFAQDLGRAQIFVQLLGPRPGKAPPDLPEGYTQHQNEAARAARIEMLQWRHPDLVLAGVADPRHRALLTGETVIADGLGAFMAEVHRRATLPAKEPTPTIGRAARVYINACPDDLPLAEQILGALKQFPLHVALRDPHAAPNRRVSLDIDENLINCDVLITIYGNAPPDWVSGNLLRFVKVSSKRKADPKLVALFTGPPEEKRLPLPVHVSQMIEIDCRRGVSMEPIRDAMRRFLAS